MNPSFPSKSIFCSLAEFTINTQLQDTPNATIYLALHQKTFKKYALKIFSDPTQSQKKAIQRQIQIHRNLSHPHIIKLWDAFEDEENIVLVLEYAQNGSLFNYHSQILSEQRSLVENEIYKYFYQTVEAVDYLHYCGYMHRDIKPQNILLDHQYNVKLCDFGLATDEIFLPKTKICGTYEYMAPQMISKQFYNYKIDVWSLGILLYELAHGRAPFQGQKLQNFCQNLETKISKFDSENCSESMKKIIQKMLHPNLKQRLTLKQVKEDEWVKSRQTNEKRQRKSGKISLRQLTQNSNIERGKKDVKTQKIKKEVKQSRNEQLKVQLCNIQRKLSEISQFQNA